MLEVVHASSVAMHAAATCASGNPVARRRGPFHPRTSCCSGRRTADGRSHFLQNWAADVRAAAIAVAVESASASSFLDSDFCLSAGGCGGQGGTMRCASRFAADAPEAL